MTRPHGRRRTRRGRAGERNRAAEPDTALATLAAMLDHARPEVDANGVPAGPSSSSAFRFPCGVEGVYDASTGLVTGAKYETVPMLATCVWGTDAWVSSEFGEMVPRPRLEDLRGNPAAVTATVSLGPWRMEPGDPEVVLRVDRDDFVSIVNAGRKDGH